MVIVPVGFDMGPVYAEEGPPDRPPMRYEVHLGGGPRDLDELEYTVWRAAFADPDAHAGLKVDRARLERYLRDEGHAPAGRISDPEPVVDRLVGQDLLLEFDADGDLEDVFGIHRLYPRAPALDSQRDDPMFHDIGFDEPLCEIPPNVFTAWAFGMTEATLWAACDMVAEIADADLAPGREPMNLSAGEVAKQVALNLPYLLSTKAAFLDLLNYELPRILEPMRFPPSVEHDRDGDGRSPVIVPVGLRLGYEYFDVDPARFDEEELRVHFGDQLLELPDDEAAAWTAAFADPVRHARNEVTRDWLERKLRSNPAVADPAAVVDRLLEQGLLVEFDPVAGPLEELFGSVQLYPLGDGLGNSPDDPRLYRIGDRGETRLAVPPEVYAIWSYSLTGRTLWSACADLAEGYDEDLQPGEEPAGFTAEEFARDVAAVLPALIASRCAFIDPLNYFL